MGGGGLSRKPKRPLSAREAEAVALLRKGKPYKIAAFEMGVKPATFRTLVGRAFRKLEIHSRIDLWTHR